MFIDFEVVDGPWMWALTAIALGMAIEHAADGHTDDDAPTSSPDGVSYGAPPPATRESVTHDASADGGATHGPASLSTPASDTPLVATGAVLADSATHASSAAPSPERDAEHESWSEPSLLDRAFATGALVTIATGGALIGLGLREGEAGRVFRLVGRALLERGGVASGSAPLTSVTIGYLHHLIIATVWGVGLALATLPLRGARRVIASALAALLYPILALNVVTPTLRIGYSVTSSLSSVVSITAALLVALLGGVWLASSDSDAVPNRV